jgi:hypothetical protein
VNVALAFCSAFETNASGAVVFPAKSRLGGKLAQPRRLTYIPAIGGQRHAD